MNQVIPNGVRVFILAGFLILGFQNCAKEQNLIKSSMGETQPADIKASYTTSGGRLRISVANVGDRGETKITDGHDWQPFDSNKWANFSGTWTLDQPLAKYPQGTVYEMHFRNPETQRETLLKVAIPVSEIEATVVKKEGVLQVKVVFAGPNAQAKGIVPEYDWTPFDTNKWTFDPNTGIWELIRPLSAYEPNTYVGLYRNPDTGKEIQVTIEIP